MDKPKITNSSQQPSMEKTIEEGQQKEASTETDWSKRVSRKASEVQLTDTRLAEIIGISRSTVSLWMNGKRLPKLEYKIKLANALGVSLNWLETGQDVLPEHHLPVITLQDLADYLHQGKTVYDVQNRVDGRSDHQITRLKANHTGFLLEMSNDSMTNGARADSLDIPEGATVQIDVNLEPKNGTIILVEYQNQIKLRLWKEIEPGLHNLRVINQNLREMNFNFQGDINDIYRGTAIAFSKMLY